MIPYGATVKRSLNHREGASSNPGDATANTRDSLRPLVFATQSVFSPFHLYRDNNGKTADCSNLGELSRPDLYTLRHYTFHLRL